MVKFIHLGHGAKKFAIDTSLRHSYAIALPIGVLGMFCELSFR
ncbi:hypothetical protein WAE58_20765 [Pedobacter panaciterrae]|uniref:Uncharacterized protein n=1 Tax=Pedobacter panaciterrae TaxID=363849 RepID=A0ABU8NRL1_9SPHI|nr:hypothetical protein [uncultured Pedobacter sp.]